MASRASRLLGGLLDRILPSPRPGRHRPWGRPGQQAGPQPWPKGTPPASPPWGVPRPPRRRPTADEVRLATASADRVDVRVVGTVPPDDALVDGEIEGEPDRAAQAADPDAGVADPAARGEKPPDAEDPDADDPDPDADGGRRAPLAAAAAAPPRRQRRLRDDLFAAVAIAAVVLLALLTVVYRGPIGDWLTRQRVEQAAGAFARAWQTGRLGSVQYDASTTGRPGLADADALSALVARRSQAVTAGLTSATPDTPTSVTLAGSARVIPSRGAEDRTATQRARVVWTLDGGRRWAYDTVLTLREHGSRWRVVWSPQTVHPGLTADGGLVAERVQPARAPIVGSRSRPLATTLVAHRVTFRSSALIRPRGDLHTIADLTGLDRERLTDAVTSRPRGSTVPVVVLRDAQWKRVSGRLLRIKGVTATTLRVAAPRTTTYARSLLGEALPASAATARASGGRVVAGELVGTTGLQRTFDDRLRGTSGQRVTVLPLPRTGSLAPRAVPASDPPGRVLAELAKPLDGTPLRLTLDAGVQRAAQAAVDGVRGKRASLVAVDVRSGRVLAVASNVAEEWDRPLLGAYPPGSTFKIVTTWALTGQGVTAADELRCPGRIVVRGNPFRNAHAPVGTAPLARQFAESCNTAFAGLGARVPDADVQSAARDLGLTVPYTGLGVGAFPGVVPRTPDAAVHAASLIGQGKVEVSPLSMAVASATVAGGRFRSPQLVLGTGRTAPPAGAALDPFRLGTMRSLMCETVRSGTATGLRSAPGGPVHGKTGTAQYGSPDPVGAHAWFTGYQGDLAFAVVVEKGGFGADAAVPLARTFLGGVHDGERARPASSCGAATAALR
jgi:cell division protein FtsI/penicillin-binding protein 2